MRQHHDLYNQILNLIYTKVQRDETVSALKELTSLIYETNINLSDKIKDILPYTVAEKVLDVCDKASLVFSDKKATQEFFKALNDSLSSLKVIDMTFAFKPSERLIVDIASWLSANAEEKLLIGVSVDESIVGGLAINLSGNHREYSLRKKLQEKFNKKEFTDLISIR